MDELFTRADLVMVGLVILLCAMGAYVLGLLVSRGYHRGKREFIDKLLSDVAMDGERGRDGKDAPKL